MRAGALRRVQHQIKWEHEEGEEPAEAAEEPRVAAGNPRRGHRVPRLVVLHVAVVGVVGAVGDAPRMVRHEDGRVHDVANRVIQRAAGAERSVAATVENTRVSTCNVLSLSTSDSHQSWPTTNSDQNMLPCASA